ncbi:MAG: hypothetical protein WCX74_02960 [Candidatus Paceibacterota bacterium]
MNNLQKNIIVYSILFAYSFLFLFSVFNAIISSNPHLAFSIFIQLGSFLATKNIIIGNIFVAFFLLEFILMTPLIYLFSRKLIRKTTNHYEKYLLPLLLTVEYLLFAFFTTLLGDACLGEVCSILLLPSAIIINHAFLAILFNGIFLFIALFILLSIAEPLTSNQNEEKQNLYPYTPYVPTVIYIIIFSFLAIFFPSTRIILSLSAYLGNIANINSLSLVFFEFIAISNLTYFLTKKWWQTSGHKEHIIFPFLVTIGYALWAIPLVCYSISCAEKGCIFVIIIPLSYATYISLQSIAGPFLALIINGLIVFYTTKFSLGKKNMKNENK